MSLFSPGDVVIYSGHVSENNGNLIMSWTVHEHFFLVLGAEGTPRSSLDFMFTPGFLCLDLKTNKKVFLNLKQLETAALA